nr:WAS/WASL-interacting protein family member 1-like [Globicephala melas]
MSFLPRPLAWAAPSHHPPQLPAFNTHDPGQPRSSRGWGLTLLGRGTLRPGLAPGLQDSAAEVRIPPQPLRLAVLESPVPRAGGAQAFETSGPLGPGLWPHLQYTPAPPITSSLSPSPTGRGKTPPVFSQAPGQPPPRPQPGPASGIKAGFNCTNKCLPRSFFFFFPNQRRAACENLQIQRCAYQSVPCRPGGSHRCRAGPQRQSTHLSSLPALHTAPPAPPRAQGPGCRTHSLAPSAPLAAGPRGLGGGWVDALPEGTAGPASHSTWPMRWALKRVQPGGLGGPAHPMGRGETAAGAPSNMPPPTRHDCLPLPRQPLTLRSDIPCGEGVGS